MPDRHRPQPPTPEDSLDRWLDALNDPRRSTPPAPPGLEEVAATARRYRDVLGIAPHARPGTRAIPERNGAMNHALPLATPKPDAWRVVRPANPRRTDRRGRLAQLSTVLTTAMVVALLLGLGGAMIAQQGGLPGGSSDPPRQPGVAGFPSATPTGESLSCASPGYRAVIEGEVNADSLALLGDTEPPIVIGQDDVTIPVSDGEALVVSKGDFAVVDAGAVVNHFDDGSSTVTRLSDGESWYFPAIEHDDPWAGQPFGNGRYYVAATDETLTNWYVLDTATGERTTTADIVGDPFQGPLSPLYSGMSLSDDGDPVFIVTFVPFAGAVLTQGSDFSPNVLVIPDDLSHAYFRWLSSETIVSPGGDYLASYNEIIEAATGEIFTGIPGDDFLGYVRGMVIAFLNDDPAILMYTGNEIRRIEPSVGEEYVLFEADAPIHEIGYDPASNTLIIGAGEQEAERWTWIDLDTSQRKSMPNLQGFHLNRTGPTRTIRHLDVTADFIRPLTDDTYSIRAVDMNTGRASVEMTNTVPEGDSGAEFGFYLTNVLNGIVTAETSSGGHIVIDPATDATFEIEKPHGLDFNRSDFTDGVFALVMVSPSNQCLVLNVYNEGGQPTGSSYVAAVEPGASWTEVDTRISYWVGTDEPAFQTLPAMDVASPVATPAG